MEYTTKAPVSNIQSPSQMSESLQNFGESHSSHSTDCGSLSSGQCSIYEEKPNFQYQNQSSSLNQLLQNNQHIPYTNPSVRTHYQTNYRNFDNWNIPRSQSESFRMYYTQYQEDYSHMNDVASANMDKMNMNESSDVSANVKPDVNYKTESRFYQNDEQDKTRSHIAEWKQMDSNESSSPSISHNKDSKINESETKVIDQTDPISAKSESNINTIFPFKTCNSDSSDKNEMNGPCYAGYDKNQRNDYNSTYPLSDKSNPVQFKTNQPSGYESSNYGHVMMHPNSNYYSQFRYPVPHLQNNTQNYMSPNNPAMMANSVNRAPVMNYPAYLQTSSPGPGYGYPPGMNIPPNRSYNMHTTYASRTSHSPFPTQDAYMNGTVTTPQNTIKEVNDKKELNSLSNANQESSSAGSNSTKSLAARSCVSKTKNTTKNESHPATPLSNNVPSPSQTSMSSMVDENDDSVSSLGPSETSLMHHPSSTAGQSQSQYNQQQQHPMTQQPMPLNPSMMYSQPYSNTQMPHPMMGSFPGHISPQQRPFPTSNPSMMPSRPYHSDIQTHSSVYQKLMELGNEPERSPWIERYLRFMQENNTPLTAVPTVVKQPLDLFRLYHAVRERGGLLNVVKTKRWKEICLIVNVNASASGAYTLRRNYIKCLLDYECKFDRNGADPGPILQEIQSLSDKKKKSSSRNSGSSPSSSISSGQASQHNSDYVGSGSSTPRPSLPHPDFNSPHTFPTHNPYNSVIHNGSLMHRSPMHYPPQRGHNPYPTGPYSAPRMIGFNSPVNSMHPNVRYDTNIQQNWNKSMMMNQHQWSGPGPNTNSSSAHPMQMPMSPGTSNTISTASQQSQAMANIQEHSRRMDWKSSYGGMPPPPPPPPNAQTSGRPPILPPNLPNTSQLGPVNSQFHSNMTHCNYSSQNHGPMSQPRPMSCSSVSSNAVQQSRVQPSNSNGSDPMNYITKSMGSTTNTMPNSIQNISSSCHNRSHNDNSRLNQTFNPQVSYSKSNASYLKRYDNLFPPNCVESTQTDFNRKRKLCSKDIKAFNPTNVTMALKSGLVAEITWALNYLNIWSRDDSFFDKLNLKNLMPLFQSLIEIWRNSLGTIFGSDLFIRDLELPIFLKEFGNKIHLKNTLGRIDYILKNYQLKRDTTLDNGDLAARVAAAHVLNLRLQMKNGTVKVDTECQIIHDKIIELLNGFKYALDRRGLPVRLEYKSKLDGIFNGDQQDLADFIIRTSCRVPPSVFGSNTACDQQQSDEYEYDCCKDGTCVCDAVVIRELWKNGGSDTTFHIQPSILCQRNATTDWYNRLTDSDLSSTAHHYSTVCCADLRGPPEIKRSRCNSPPISFKSSSSPPPPSLEKENIHIALSKTTDCADDSEYYRLQAKMEIISDGESLFFEVAESDEEKILRCISVSTIIRNLSFLSGNDRVMAANRGLLVILGRLLLLGHDHSPDDWPSMDADKERWWMRWIDDIREHVLVTLVNISSYLEFNNYGEMIIQPIITGILHWLTCKSAAAEDALPSHRVLGCRRLALECLMRLCVHEKNSDFILTATEKGNDRIIIELFNYLASSFCYPDVQVVKEMSLAVMHYLSMGGENGLGCIYLANAQPSIISGLISFIEITESQIRHVVENMGMEALQARPELMGTSLEFLRHSGALINRIASYEVNRKHFTRDHEIRMLNLVISTVLDQTVAQSISGVLFLLSNHQESLSDKKVVSSQKFKSFLTFNDLSFCEKDVSSNSENESVNCAN